MNERTPPDDRVAEAVALISKKWHPVIIQALLESGPLRFHELRDRLDGISDKVLTDSLADLQENDLVERRVVTEAPKRVEYDLTRAGRELQAVIESLADWGRRNIGESPRPTVLVVDDDPRLARMHADWLAEEYDVELAFNGKQAISALSAGVDVVLLDRRMPGLSGDELLEKIRDAGLDCRVVMLTAVEPDLDVADMEFDAYVVKPGGKAEVQRVVADLLDRADEDEAMIEYLSLLARRSLLDAKLPVAEREESDEYRRLVERIERLEDDLGETPDRAEDAATIADRLDL